MPKSASTLCPSKWNSFRSRTSTLPRNTTKTISRKIPRGIATCPLRSLNMQGRQSSGKCFKASRIPRLSRSSKASINPYQPLSNLPPTASPTPPSAFPLPLSAEHSLPAAFSAVPLALSYTPCEQQHTLLNASLLHKQLL